MGHSVTIGGERLGAGSKNKTYLHNYERSTHNLNRDFLSTMGCGMLIPFMNKLVTRDDKYEIDLYAGLRTIPTKGPLFGSFKLQLDVFKCPLRLYQALLHNNPMAIGLRANQVKFPKIRLYDEMQGAADAGTYQESKAAKNSLVKYLGISGIGTMKSSSDDPTTIHRDFFGSSVLAYYDIFKNYYANKQEENAYTLTTVDKHVTGKQLDFKYVNSTYFTVADGNITEIWEETIRSTTQDGEEERVTYSNSNYEQATDAAFSVVSMHFLRTPTDTAGDISAEQFEKQIIKTRFAGNGKSQVINGTIKELIEAKVIRDYLFEGIDAGIGYNTTIRFNLVEKEGELMAPNLVEVPGALYFYEEQVVLEPFELENIDKMRYDLLAFAQLGQSYVLDGDEGLEQPYYSAIGDSADYYWKKPLAGICVKTYQSDLFNNWLNTELIDGENGIAEITAISTSEGAITIDQLQFSEKLYNLLNRIAISGNTYQDYLDAAYTKSAKRFEETPMWLGGMSDEIVFEEIVQTAPAGDTQLGTLGGRGNLLGKRNGGKITVHIDEPSMLIGIVSITPRIVYTQGNEWFNTEIDSLMDIHVPALDGIGFQNLMAEEMHSSAAIIDEDSVLQERAIIGKIPAWLHYMTDIDQAYGDFAAEDGDGFMVLNRNYDVKYGELQDATTYIDPAKYNYPFAYTKREAQNFWVKIKCNIKARRLMSAKQIPTA